LNNFYFLIIFYLLFGHNDTYAKDRFQNYDAVRNDSDSIVKWIDSSRMLNLSKSRRNFYLRKAYEESLKESDDSLRNVYFTKIAFTSYFKLGDSLMFRKVNRQAIDLSKEINDSLNLANNYWDLGEFYSDYEIKDSSFYSYSKAQKIFNSLKYNKDSGIMLSNMAIIQSEQKDYTGSEVTTIKALMILNPLHINDQIYKCYNNLGVIYNELEEYDQALFYHNKALQYQKLINKKNTLKENTLNNIGVVCQGQQKYKEAINNFQIALEADSLKERDIDLYAKLLDNLALSKLQLNDTTNIKQLFLNAYKIRDSLHDFSGMAVSKLNLAAYYAFTKDTVKAIQLANETIQLTTAKKNDRDLLASLLLLLKLDKNNSNKYSNQYIALEDKLHREERAIRNKFARIRFETNEYIDENTKLSEQKAKLSEQNKLILVIGSVILLMGLLITIIFDQRSKNVKLRLEQRQQKANEQIFDLMLVQQYKLDEGRRNEKKRISEELHDGILGRLFGTRLILGTLNDKNDKETIVKRKKYISELQQVEEEIRNVSHELNEKSLDRNIGFIQMIEILLEKQSEITNYNYKIKYDNKINWAKIRGSLKMNLYRIIQEATQNINKYANAKNVFVEFKIEKQYLLLILNDDGIGFNTDYTSKGIGLKNMRSRVKELNGKISIKSKQNEGTSILIEVPY